MTSERDFPGRMASHCVYAFSTLADGNMSLTSGDTAVSLVNRENFFWKLKVDYARVVMPRQVHGCRVEKVTVAHTGRGAKRADTGLADTDAIITGTRDLCMAILVADCSPVFLVDAKTPSAGLVHAGWKSCRQGICGSAVARMRDEFGSSPADISALLGPCIRACCYRVSEEFRKVFPASVKVRGGELFMDLAGENRRQLLAAGLSPENIFDTGACTCCSGEDYFSYRRQGESCGRQAAVLMLR